MKNGLPNIRNISNGFGKEKKEENRKKPGKYEGDNLYLQTGEKYDIISYVVEL